MVSKDTIYRQEAIDALETVKPIKAENGELYITKINARMKLEKLPSAQSKQRMRQIDEDTVLFSVPEEDLDSTGRVILEAGRWCKTFYADEHPRMKGRWAKGINENGVTTSLFCSSCNYENKHWYEWNYCPKCGADMREDVRNE